MGQRWTRRELSEGELDLGLLIWGLEYSVDPTAFGPKRHVLRLETSDQPAHKRFYWFVCENDKLDRCVSDPGGGTDLFLEAALTDLISVYRGDVSMAIAIKGGQLTVDGAPKLTRRLMRWFNFDTRARTPPAESGPARRLASTGSEPR